MSKNYETPICEIRVTLVDCLEESTLPVGDDDTKQYPYGKE